MAPPGNRQPTPNEIDLCTIIKRHIQLIDPKVLVLVGGTAAKSLLNKKEGIMRLRGRWFEYDIDVGHYYSSFPFFIQHFY